jgi:radical SAM superfamily enzyme YgiQ (UPF0313 family)
MTNLKLLLTTPYIDKIVEPLYDSPNFVRTSLATLAGFVRANSDVSIKCIDAKFDQLNLKALLAEIEEFKPDVIGISAFTYEFEEAAILAKEIKEKYSDQCLIVVGGSHVSALPVETLKRYSSFDLCAIGESEITLLEIIRNISERNWVSIDGIAFKNIQGEIIQTKPRAKIDNLNSLPMPAWDMLPKATEYFIQSSRGCPFKCYFCFNPNGTTVRLRSATDIITEVNWIIEHIHPKRISFGDEAFGTNKAESLNLLDLMIENNISEKTTWDIQTHVSFIDEVLIGKLKLAGVSKIEMGVETGSEAIMKSIGKGITKEKVLIAFNLCKKYKINTGAFFILGHPEDTKKTIWETIRFAAKINPTEPILGILVPFPGTRISSNIDYNIENWSNFRKQINGTLPISELSNISLKKYLVIAIPVVFLRNYRFFGFSKYIITNSNNLFKFVKHLFN